MVGICPYDHFVRDTLTFCEQRLCSLIVEPQNAWSNLVVILAGILLWRKGRTAGLYVAFLGSASFVYHATATRVGAVIDLAGMYLVVSHFFWHANAPGMRPMIGTWITTISCTVVTVLAPSAGIVLFLVLLVALLGRDGMELRRLSADERRKKIAAAGVFLLATIFWLLDQSGVICPYIDYGINGHAIWHVLSAVAMYWYGMALGPRLVRSDDDRTAG